MMIDLGDTLALALAIVLLAGFGLLRFRGGTLGILLIGLFCRHCSLDGKRGSQQSSKWRKTVCVNPPGLFGNGLSDWYHSSYRHLVDSAGT
jgi:hypothetical protein